MPLHKKKRRIFPWGSKRFSLFLRKSFGSFENSLTRDSCVDISGAGSWILSENRGYIHISSRTALTTWGFYLAQFPRRFHVHRSEYWNIPVCLLQKILCFASQDFVNLKKKIEDSWIIHGTGFLELLRTMGMCFRTSLVAPVIWHHFQWPPAQRWLSSSAFIRSN
jgi:hypothetical protein